MLSVGQTVKCINNTGLRSESTLTQGASYKIVGINEEGGVKLEGKGSTYFKASRFEIVSSSASVASSGAAASSSSIAADSVLLIDNTTGRIINTFATLSAAQSALSNGSLNLDNIRVLQAKPLRMTKTLNVTLA